MKRIKWLVAIVAITAAVAVVAACVFQRSLIYYPAGPAPPAAGVLPGAEEVSFVTGDGVRLGGWFLPASGGVTRATVIVFNGNAGNRADRSPLAAILAQQGLSVLLFDYRGYAGNAGSPTEAGLFADARAARGYVASRPDVDPTRLIYYGESLGAGIAVGLAAEQPPAALILRSPYPSLADVGRRHLWFLPVDLLFLDRFPAADWIARVPAPTLVIAAGQDRLIPPDLSRALFDAAPGPKRLVLVADADHVDPRLAAGPEVVTATRQFLDAHVNSRLRVGSMR